MDDSFQAIGDSICKKLDSLEVELQKLKELQEDRPLLYDFSLLGRNQTENNK